MVKTIRNFSLLALALLVVASDAYGQDENQPRRQRGQGRGQMDPFRLPREVELTDEQKTKLEEVKKKFEEKLKAAREKAQLTEDQRSKQRDAFRKVREEGKQGDEARKAVEEALGLTDDQKKGREELTSLSKEITTEVEGLLTDDQKAKLKEARERRGNRGNRGNRRNADAA